MRTKYCKGCRYYESGSCLFHDGKKDAITKLKACPRLEEAGEEIYVCPKCGSRTFYTSAHVVQDWLVDDTAEFMECTEECSSVVHFPTAEDLFTCSQCGFSGNGSEFQETFPNLYSVTLKIEGESPEDVKALLEQLQGVVSIGHANLTDD